MAISGLSTALYFSRQAGTGLSFCAFRRPRLYPSQAPKSLYMAGAGK